MRLLHCPQGAECPPQQRKLCMEGRLCVDRLLQLTQPSGCQVDTKAWAGLQTRLMWARRYARLNALALRKICKKHDKALGSQAGHLFLQVWSTQGLQMLVTWGCS